MRSRGSKTTALTHPFHTTGLGRREVDVGGSFLLPARELVGEDPEDCRGQVAVEGDHTRELTGQREDPLAVRHVWQDVVHHVGRLLIHAPARARRAEPHPAGERDHPWSATAGALEPHKAVAEVATGRDGAELAFDEARQRAVVVVAAGDEVVEMVPQEAGERAGFRVPRSIGPRSTRARG